MNKRLGSTYSVGFRLPEQTPSVLCLKELRALLPDSLSINLSCNLVSFPPNVESDGKTHWYFHRSVRKVIPLPILETHSGNCPCVNLQEFLPSTWKQHLFGSLDTSDQISPLTTQGTAEFLLILPRAPLWEPVQFRAQFKFGTTAKGCHSSCLCAYMTSQNTNLFLLKTKPLCHCFLLAWLVASVGQPRVGASG